MNTEQRICALAVFSLLTLFGPRQPLKEHGNSSPLTVIPFQEIAGHIYFKATLGSLPDVSVAIDTGSPEFLLSRRIYDRLKLPFIGMANLPPFLGGDTPIPAIATSVPSFRFGGIRINQLPALVLSLPPVDPRGNREIDAIIGSDLFRRYVVELDYAEKVLRFYDPSRYHKPSSGCELPLNVDTYPLVHAGILAGGSKPVDATLFLDTGGEYTLLTKSFMASHPDLSIKYLSVGPQQGQGITGVTRFRFGRVGAITLGECMIPNPVVAVPESAIGAPMGGRSFSGEIGLNMFRRFITILDYKAGFVLFRKNAGTSDNGRAGRKSTRAHSRN